MAAISTAEQGLQTLKTLLTSALANQATVQTEFGDRRQALPVKQVILSLGVKNAGVLRHENSEGVATLERKLTVEALILAPKTYDGVDFSRLLDCMLTAVYSGRSSYTLYQFESGTVKYSTSLGALVMPVDITISF